MKFKISEISKKKKQKKNKQKLSGLKLEKSLELERNSKMNENEK